MARTSPQDAGKSFAVGVLQHLPDALRSQMESFLDSPDAVGFLTEVGNGALRQSDYSRNMNALSTWHKELTDWVQTQQETGTAAVAPVAPVTTEPARPAPAAAPAGTLTREDFNTELARRESFYAAFTADAVRLSQQHLQQFGEVLDINLILGHPRLGELRMDGAYQDVFKDKIAERQSRIQADERKQLEARAREAPARARQRSERAQRRAVLRPPHERVAREHGPGPRIRDLAAARARGAEREHDPAVERVDEAQGPERRRDGEPVRARRERRRGTREHA